MAVSVSASVRTYVDLPPDILATYEREATEGSKSVESILSQRLIRRLKWNGSRPLFFNDEQRRELEIALGGHIINSTEQALTALRSTMKVMVQGVSIELTADQLNRIKSRSRRDRTLEQNLTELVRRLIDAYLRGEIA